MAKPLAVQQVDHDFAEGKDFREDAADSDKLAKAAARLRVIQRRRTGVFGNGELPVRRSGPTAE